MARRQAVVDTAAGLVPFGHLGWAYRTRDEFGLQAARYLADGLAEGQWVEYVGAGDPADLHRELADLRRSGASDVDPDRVAVTPIHEFYDMPADADVVDPDVAVRRRMAATEEAVAAGYTGFRAVVDTTPIVGTPAQRECFARFEFLIDQKMAVMPVSALCAVDARALGDAAAELTCLHPLTNPGAARFRLYADPAVDAAVAGEIDMDSSAGLLRALDRIGPLGLGHTLVLDAAELEFVDHRGLDALERYARDLDRDIVLRTNRTVIGRLNDLLELSRVHVIEAPACTDREPGVEEDLLTRLAHRERQLATLPDIEQAKGMLEHALGLTESQAFDTLVRLSQHTNTKLREVAVLLRDELAGTASDRTRRTAEELIVRLHERLRARD